MKAKTKKHNPDFFSNAKKIMGEKRYSRAIKKGQEKANELCLKMAREKLGFTQVELKGISQPDVSKIEKRKDLKISTLEKYAKAMGMKLKISFVSKDDGKEKVIVYGN